MWRFKKDKERELNETFDGETSKQVYRWHKADAAEVIQNLWVSSLVNYDKDNPGMEVTASVALSHSWGGVRQGDAPCDCDRHAGPTGLWCHKHVSPSCPAKTPSLTACEQQERIRLDRQGHISHGWTRLGERVGGEGWHRCPQGPRCQPCAF